MVTSDEIYAAVQRIAATPSKNDKVEQLKAVAASEQGARILDYAYNPFVTFGVGEKSLAEAPVIYGADGVFNHETFEVLDELAARKLSGNAAIAEIHAEMARLSLGSAWLFKHILLKDLRAGFTDSSINKAKPGLIPTFDCMLAHPFKDFAVKVRYPVFVEPKLDGVRVLTFVTNAEVRFFSRSGKEFTTFDHLKAPVKLMLTNWRMNTAPGDEKVGVGDGWVLDAEVVSGAFNKTVGDVRRKDTQATDAKLYIFDMMSIPEFNGPAPKDEVKAGSYVQRRERLLSAMHYASALGPQTLLQMLPSFKAGTEEQVYSLYEQMREKGLEGVIVKDPNASYFKKRSAAWLKIKGDISYDLSVVDMVEGTGKYAGMLGALVVEFEGVRVNVGTGLDDAQRQSFWVERELVIGRLAEIEAHEVTPDGSLRHPRFKRWRDDKAE